MDRVKLDVYANNKNSLTSIANAINAPAVTLIAKTIASDENVSDFCSDNFQRASPKNKKIFFNK